MRKFGQKSKYRLHGLLYVHNMVMDFYILNLANGKNRDTTEFEVIKSRSLS